MLGLDKHHSRTNIAVGQTSQSDNNTVRQMSQSNKFHSRTNVTVRQKLWSDKCRCRTNVAVGQTSLSDKCHGQTNVAVGQTSRYLIFKVLVNNKKATKLQKVFFQQYHHLDFPWSVFVYLIIQRECVEDE